ncbi:MAG: hypothetical protein U0271_14120 [Polyangiaceae bacterium]
MRAGLALVMLAGLSACSGGAPTPTVASTGKSSKPVASVKPRPTPARPACEPDNRASPNPTDQPDRDAAVASIIRGRPDEAMGSLSAILERNPSSLVATTLSPILQVDINEQRQAASQVMARVRPLKFEVVEPPKHGKGGTEVKLSAPVKESSMGDWIAWLNQASIPNPIGYGGEQEMPTVYGQTFMDQPIYATYPSSGAFMVRYGPSLLVAGDEQSGLRAFDFEPQIVAAFKKSLAAFPDLAPASIFPELRFATLAGSKLIAQVAHEGDGNRVKADGAVIAFDLAENKVAWVSELGVGNNYSGYVTGKHYVTAFSQPTTTTIQVLDLTTGDIVATSALDYRADYVVGHDATIYAWGYDAVAKLTLSVAAPAEKVNLGSTITTESHTLAKLDDVDACFLKNAVNALDRRDGAKLVEAAQNLPPSLTLSKGLRAAGEFLVARANGVPGIDLTEKTPTALTFTEGPIVAKLPTKPEAPKRKLVAVKDPNIEPPPRPFLTPIQLYSSFRFDLYPSTYGSTGISAGFRVDDDVYLFYGGRYIARLKNDQVELIWDAKPLASPIGSATQPVYFQTIVEGVIYVITTSATYGQTGSTAYAAALDRNTGAIIWRTAAGISPRPPVVFENLMILSQNDSKSGKLLVVRMDDGQVVQTVTLKENITDYGWDGRGPIYVNTSKGREYYMLK